MTVFGVKENLISSNSEFKSTECDCDFKCSDAMLGTDHLSHSSPSFESYLPYMPTISILESLLAKSDFKMQCNAMHTNRVVSQ